ncbi:protein of unknown function (plasmid) [Cupriavidus taiwanensis]|uniref:RES domain-containing protein n=1 Tax=Cupriavidus taiwanensis TaxID=164546 RepID=A0A375HK94_9BURK|nr:hypothetical protein CBM2592_B100287 [Cupriavidus taiwanensis]SOY62638.1 hypothetical protein CBM2588_B110067 [Cupriavidus taiwanensis]SOY98075.1 hypothetical protein CBM2591_B80290 [Cupriavidus taiwanensis]SOZ31789.1 hypothetical protein CBM2608_B90142 [Cupriavidus taiwanensis]SOZ68399.1 hypothetical protein CBM2617_B120097 [Cupriavidus taiwanensis]
MRPAWRIATDTPLYTADDASGAGAGATGGSWNRQGTLLIYAASSTRWLAWKRWSTRVRPGCR